MKTNARVVRNLLLIALCLPAGAARGQTQLVISAIEIDEASGQGRKLSDTELKDYFNTARCACNNGLRVRVKFSWPQGEKPNGSIKIVSGPTSCVDTEKRIETTDCRVHYSELIKKLDSSQTFIEQEIPAAELMLRPGKDCVASAEQTAFTLYVFTDSAENERFDPAQITRKYAVDTDPPEAPKPGKEPQGGEGMVNVFFDKPDSGEQNLKYQVLCQKVDAPADRPRAANETPAYELASTAESCTAASGETADGGVKDDMTTFALDDAGTVDGAPADGGPGDGSAGDAALADGGVPDLSALDQGTAEGSAAADASAAIPEGIREAKYVCSGATSSAGSLTITGLEDGVLYRFYVVSIDDVKNPSEPVELGTGRPTRDEDLWERYKRAGGTAESGCALAGAGDAAWLGGLAALLAGVLLGALRRSRRARRSTGALLLLAVVALPGAARAQDDEVRITDTSRFASPQHFAAEVKFGPYAPQIDSEFEGAGPGPFERLFGDGEALMVRGEIDYQIWRGFGSIGVGLSGGYYRNSANALLDNGADGSPATGDERSAGETAITLVPLSLLAVYRFDVLAERYAIPLVPFVKIGLGYTLWWIEKSDGSLANVDGDEAMGGSLGLQFNAGLALLLNVFEPTAAKNLDNDIGINHTYLFFEFAYAQADGFASDTKLDVGDTTWQGGLAFEF